MFSRGSKELRTPRTDAVDGISCMSPWAPLRDKARGLNPDSARITAVTSRSGMPYRLAASVISRAYGTGSPCGSRSQPASVPLVKPIRWYLGSAGAFVKRGLPSRALDLYISALAGAAATMAAAEAIRPRERVTLGQSLPDLPRPARPGAIAARPRGG